MNEEQLLHLGKDLIPLGDPLVYINHIRQDLFRTTQLSMQNIELIIKVLSPEEIVFTLSINFFPSPFPGHFHWQDRQHGACT